MADRILLEMTRSGNIGGRTVTMEEETVLRVRSGAAIYSGQMDMGGTIHLYDNLDYYEDSRWAVRQVYNLIYDQNHTRSQESFEAIVTEATGANTVLSPYTYQGCWTYRREGDPLVAIWNLTGSIQDIRPEQEGNIVSHALYTSSQNLRSLAGAIGQYMDVARFNAFVKNNYWAKGIGDFSVSRNAHDLDGYKYRAGADVRQGEEPLLFRLD